MVKKIWKKILRNISKSQADLESIAVSYLPIHKLRNKISLNISTWFCRQVKFLDYWQRMKSKLSWEMPEMIMPNSLRVLIQQQVSFTIILLIELEITCTCVCASRLLGKSSEIVSENSLLSLMSAQLIGSCLGPKRL